MSMNQKKGFSTIFVFMLLMSFLATFGIVFYMAQQTYLVACKRYQFYQIKYELEGLVHCGLNHIIRYVKEQEKTLEKIVTKHFDDWCTIGNALYSGVVRIEPINKEKCFIFVQLKSNNTIYNARCAILFSLPNRYQIADFSFL